MGYFLEEHSLLNGPVFIQTLKVEPKTSFENANGKQTLSIICICLDK